MKPIHMAICTASGLIMSFIILCYIAVPGVITPVGLGLAFLGHFVIGGAALMRGTATEVVL